MPASFRSSCPPCPSCPSCSSWWKQNAKSHRRAVAIVGVRCFFTMKSMKSMKRSPDGLDYKRGFHFVVLVLEPDVSGCIAWYNLERSYLPGTTPCRDRSRDMLSSLSPPPPGLPALHRGRGLGSGSVSGSIPSVRHSAASRDGLPSGYTPGLGCAGRRTTDVLFENHRLVQLSNASSMRGECARRGPPRIHRKLPWEATPFVVSSVTCVTFHVPT